MAWPLFHRALPTSTFAIDWVSLDQASGETARVIMGVTGGRKRIFRDAAEDATVVDQSDAGGESPGGHRTHRIDGLSPMAIRASNYHNASFSIAQRNITCHTPTFTV